MQNVPSGHNPYAPPVAAGAASTQWAAGAPLDWEIGEVLAQAWGIFKQHALVLVLAPIIVQVISQVVGFAIQLPMAAVGDSVVLLVVLGVVAFVAQMGVAMFFAVGLTRLFVGAARGETPEFGVLFSGGDRILPVGLCQLLLGLAVGIGMVLLIVPGIIAALGLMFGLYYCVDRSMGPVESLRTSWDATQGQRGKLFLYGLACVGLVLLGVLACIVGILVAYPLILLGTAIIYTRLSGTAGAPALGGGAPSPAWGGVPAGSPQPAGAGPGMGAPMSPGAAPGMHPMSPPGAPQQGYPGAPQQGYPGAGHQGPPGAPQPGYPGAPGGVPQDMGGGPAAPPGVGGQHWGTAPAPTQPGVPNGPSQQRVGPGGTQIIQQFDPSKLDKK